MRKHVLEFSSNKERAKALGLKPAPVIKGYFLGKEKTERILGANSARGKRKYPWLYIETIEECNLKCWFCYSYSGRKITGRRISLEDMKMAVDALNEHGLETVIVAGRGEPLLDENLFPLIEYVTNKGLWFVLFTNNTLIKPEIASELYSVNTSVIAKLGSLDACKQDSIVGMEGAHVAIRKGLNLLLEAGFREPRLAVDITITKRTMDEMEHIWRYLRQRHIVPYLEPLIESGRALENPDKLEKERLSSEAIGGLFQRLREIDEHEFGYTWVINRKIRTPGAEECTKNKTALTLRQSGDIGTCINDLELVVGNIFHNDLIDIIKNSPTLKKLRLDRTPCQCKYCGVRIEK